MTIKFNQRKQTARHLVASPVERLEEDQGPANSNAMQRCSAPVKPKQSWTFKNKKIGPFKPISQTNFNKN